MTLFKVDKRPGRGDWGAKRGGCCAIETDRATCWARRDVTELRADGDRPSILSAAIFLARDRPKKEGRPSPEVGLRQLRLGLEPSSTARRASADDDEVPPESRRKM